MLRDWREIPYDWYVANALALSATEQARLETALNRLPSDIIDAHTHVARPSDVGALPPSTLTHVVSTYPCYTLDDGRRVRRRLWPGCSTRL